MIRTTKAHAATLRHLVGGALVLAFTFGATAGSAFGESIELRGELVQLRFENCSVAQQQMITQAYAAAAVAVEAVVDEITDPAANPQVEFAVDRWFGVDTSHFTLVRAYKHIANRLTGEALPILNECDLTEDSFAWTYLAMQGEGYMGFGRAFFQAALVGGWDSRMGTVVHELAHMVPGIAADDHFYGIAEMEALARKDPMMALDNAQSYEYLVEQVYDMILDGPVTSGLVVSGLIEPISVDAS